MAKDDSTVRCFQGLLIFGIVITGVSNEYFLRKFCSSGNHHFRLIKSESLKENNDVIVDSLPLCSFLRNVLVKYAS